MTTKEDSDFTNINNHSGSSHKCQDICSETYSSGCEYQEKNSTERSCLLKSPYYNKMTENQNGPNLNHFPTQTFNSNFYACLIFRKFTSYLGWFTYQLVVEPMHTKRRVLFKYIITCDVVVKPRAQVNTVHHLNDEKPFDRSFSAFHEIRSLFCFCFDGASMMSKQ